MDATSIIRNKVMKTDNYKILVADYKYKVLNKYHHAVINIQCPWCFNIISVVEDTENECSVCKRAISPDDFKGEATQ